MLPVEKEIKDKPAGYIIRALYIEIEKKPNQLLGLFRGSDKNSLRSLKSWLNHLSYISDYNCSVKTRKRLVHEIVRYLELANANETFREGFFAIIHKAAISCGDKMAMSLISLGMVYQLITIEKIKPLAEFLKRGI